MTAEHDRAVELLVLARELERLARGLRGQARDAVGEAEYKLLVIGSTSFHEQRARADARRRVQRLMSLRAYGLFFRGATYKEIGVILSCSRERATSLALNARRLLQHPRWSKHIAENLRDGLRDYGHSPRVGKIGLDR